MLQQIPITKLKPNERNPRRIQKEAFEKLMANIEKDPEFLSCRPLLAYPEGDKYIVYAGNQRLQAIKKLKWKEAPVIVTEGVDEVRIKSRVLLDNHTYGEFDWDAISSDYDANEIADLGLDSDFFENIAKGMEEVDEKEFDESLIDGLDMMVTYKIIIPNEDSTSFENQLDELLKGFSRAKKEKKV